MIRIADYKEVKHSCDSRADEHCLKYQILHGIWWELEVHKAKRWSDSLNYQKNPQPIKNKKQKPTLI